VTSSPGEKPIVIVDMDGTLADVSHRLHHLSSPKKNWKRFFALMDEDPPSEIVLRWVRNLSPDYEVVIVTGRPDQYRTNTEQWLDRHDVTYSRIFMRRSGDHRPDHVVKKELLDEIGRNRVAFIIDDRPTVCDMFRSCGMRVFQVAVGTEY
jgi:phosphoglycolate phosphatase-like HAD superfamily hydrolase